MVFTMLFLFLTKCSPVLTEFHAVFTWKDGGFYFSKRK